MLMPAGGYQRPSNPAVVSGPGAHSRRTDGGPLDIGQQPVRDITGLPYGQNQEVNDLQAAAPLPQQAGAPSPRSVEGLFDRPTERPDEPLTAGASFGDGPGPEAIGVNDSTDTPAESVDLFAEVIRRAYRATHDHRLRPMLHRLREEGR